MLVYSNGNELHNRTLICCKMLWMAHNILLSILDTAVTRKEMIQCCLISKETLRGKETYRTWKIHFSSKKSRFIGRIYHVRLKYCLYWPKYYENILVVHWNLILNFTRCNLKALFKIVNLKKNKLSQIIYTSENRAAWITRKKWQRHKRLGWKLSQNSEQLWNQRTEEELQGEPKHRFCMKELFAFLPTSLGQVHSEKIISRQ